MKIKLFSPFIFVYLLFFQTKGFAESSIVIESSKFPQHFRLAIKWKEKIPYQVEQNGQETLVVFDRDSEFQQKGVSSLPPFIKELETTNIEGSLVTKLKIAPTAELKHKWEEGTFIVDIVNHPSKKSLPLKPGRSHIFRMSNPLKFFSADSSKEVPVITKLIDSVPSIIFEWEDPVKIAAVHWGDMLIIAFNCPASFDLSSLKTSEVKLARDLSSLEIPNKSILILPLTQDYKPILLQDKNKWIIKLKNNPTFSKSQVLTPEPLVRNVISSQGLMYSIQEEEVISLEDPVTGYQLSLVPSSTLIPEPETHLQFDILPSLRGIGILHKNDDLTVSKMKEGLKISSKSPIYGTKEKDTPKERTVGEPQPLLMFKALTQEKMKETLSKKGKTLEEKYLLSAHLLLSKGKIQETLNVLKTAIIETPRLLHTPQIRALRALAAILAKDEPLATQEIFSKPLQNDPDIDFLKASYEVFTHINYEGAYNFFKDNKEVFKDHPQRICNKLALIACESAEKTNQSPNLFLNLIETKLLNSSEREFYEFYKGKSLEVDQDLKNSYTHYKALEKSKNTEVQVRARLAMIEIQIKEGKWLTDQFIQTLEELRFMWTGDETELKIGELLGDLYAREKDYVNSLKVLRETYQGMGPLVVSDPLRLKIEGLFQENILKNEGNSPLDCIVFYQEFNKFMPKNDVTPLIQLRLVESYINLDLLENAEKMLQSLLTSVKSEEIKIASLFLLAEVYGRDNKFKKALEILRSLKTQDLSAVLIEKRYFLTFKSLLSLHLYDQALEWIESHETTRNTNLQRLELAWNRKDWKIAQNILSALIYDKEEEEKIDPTLILNYAIAAFFNDDNAELKNLRDHFMKKMKESEHAEAFDVITHHEPIFEPARTTLVAKLSDLKAFEKSLHQLSLSLSQEKTKAAG